MTGKDKNSCLHTYEYSSQLLMAWPQERLDRPPEIHLPDGYFMRLYQPGDEPIFYEIMALAGWPGWNDEKLKPWLMKILPAGWFMVIQEQTGQIVATAMCLHNYKGIHPFQGELGWLACNPAHTGRGLGLAVSAAVTRRLIEARYRNIRLYTEDYRLPALKVYLQLGYLPVLYLPEMLERWKDICGKLNWPFTPEAWLLA